VVVRAQVLDPKITTNRHFRLQPAKVVQEPQLVRALRVPRRCPERICLEMIRVVPLLMQHRRVRVRRQAQALLRRSLVLAVPEVAAVWRTARAPIRSISLFRAPLAQIPRIRSSHFARLGPELVVLRRELQTRDLIPVVDRVVVHPLHLEPLKWVKPCRVVPMEIAGMLPSVLKPVLTSGPRESAPAPNRALVLKGQMAERVKRR
jgi:hypothetical protein